MYINSKLLYKFNMNCKILISMEKLVIIIYNMKLKLLVACFVRFNMLVFYINFEKMYYFKKPLFIFIRKKILKKS